MPTDAQNATILELSADMIPNPGAFVRMNFIFFRNRLLNLAVSLMRHRANRASTLYCRGEAKSHAGILGNVTNSQSGLTAGAYAAQPTGSQSIQQRQARPASRASRDTPSPRHSRHQAHSWPMWSNR